MAILTRSGMEKILRRIMDSGGMTEDMERDVERLKDDFDEREGILKGTEKRMTEKIRTNTSIAGVMT